MGSLLLKLGHCNLDFMSQLENVADTLFSHELVFRISFKAYEKYEK